MYEYMIWVFRGVCFIFFKYLYPQKALPTPGARHAALAKEDALRFVCQLEGTVNESGDDMSCANCSGIPCAVCALKCRPCSAFPVFCDVCGIKMVDGEWNACVYIGQVLL